MNSFKKREGAKAVFSFYEAPIFNKTPKKVLSINDAYELIKGESYKLVTEKLRAISDAKKAKAYKARNFNYVTFSGTFKSRNEDDLLQHSGYLVIDIDDIDNIEEVKQILIEDKHLDPALVFCSPSGNGIKCVVEIEPNEFSNSDYLTAISNYLDHNYSIQVDKCGKDVSRSCFLPHDPHVFINPKFNLSEKIRH